MSSSYDRIFGTATPGPPPTPTPEPAAPEAVPEAAPETSSYDRIFGTPTPAPTGGATRVMEPSASAAPTRLVSQTYTTPDDRTLMQRYYHGAYRQAFAGLLDQITGIPFAGASYLAAGLAAVAKDMDPEMAHVMNQGVANINRGVGEGLALIDTIAGRPVVTIPAGVPLIGGQDAYRLVASFAPLPFVAGEQLVAKGGQAAVKSLAKAYGFQLAVAEARPAYELATATTQDQTHEAIMDAVKAIGSSAVLTATFAGFGALKSKVQEARRDYAIDQAKSGAPQLEKGMSAAVLKDAFESGSPIGDSSARVKEILANLPKVPEGAKAPILERPRLDFYTSETVQTPDGQEWRVLSNTKREPGKPATVELWRKDPKGETIYETRPASTLTDVSPLYDPEIGAKAVRLKDGSVVLAPMDTAKLDFGHAEAAIEAANRGLKDMLSDKPEDVGRIWGPEKRFYPELDYHEAVRMKAERQAALVEIETLERMDKIAHDAAAASGAPGSGQYPPGHGYPGAPDDVELTAAAVHIIHGQNGGSSWNFDRTKLPNVRPEWKAMGPAQKLWEWAVLKPFNPLLTVEQQSNLRWTIGEFNKDFRDRAAAAAQYRNGVEELFPILTREERMARKPNTGYLAQTAAAIAENKFTIGDRVADYSGKVWKITGLADTDLAQVEIQLPDGKKAFKDVKVSGVRWKVRHGNEEKTIPETAFAGWGLLHKEAAKQGFTWDQNLFVEQGIGEHMNQIHRDATASGALEVAQYLTDYMVRSYEPPPGWNKEDIKGFVQARLSAEAAKNEHALQRSFRLHEEALAAGFKSDVNHISTLIYNYEISMADAIARSTVRRSVATQLESLGLISHDRPNPNWTQVKDADAPEFKGGWIPKDAFKMIRPVFEAKGGIAGLEKLDFFNHVAKRFGLGLDFYNTMNIARGSISSGQVPYKPLLDRYVEGFETSRPDLPDKFLQGGLTTDVPTDAIARDQAKERDRHLAGEEDYIQSVREGKYGEASKRAMLRARGIFYWIEENAVQNLMSSAKKAAAYKEFTKAEAFEMDRLGRDLTPTEQRNLIQETAKNVNGRFGGQALEQMGRSKMAKIIARTFLLSPDWTESRLRLYANGIHEGVSATLAPIRAAMGNYQALADLSPQKTQNLRSSLVLFGTTLAATELANWALNGHTTDKNDKGNEFYVQLPIETKYGTHPGVNLWGYQEMPLRLMQHFAEGQPELFFNERQAPAMNAVTTALFSLDNFGEKLKGDLPFMRPPISEREKQMRVDVQKAMIIAGQIVPSVFVDMGVAMDRSIKDGAIDSVRASRALANFVSIKVNSNYPQEMRQQIDFFETHAVQTRAEVKRLYGLGKWNEAQNLKRDWNDQVEQLQGMIRSDPSARTVFRNRSDTISTFKIR